jgi:hypothetical protein
MRISSLKLNLLQLLLGEIPYVAIRVERAVDS